MPQEKFNYIQKIGRRRYQVFYGLEEDGYSKLSAIVEYKPTLEEIKEMVLDAINKEIDRTILTALHREPVQLQVGV